MQIVQQGNSKFYPIHKDLISLCPPLGKIHYSVNALLKENSIEYCYLKEPDYLEYQTKLSNILSNNKTLNKKNVIILGTILNGLFDLSQKNNIANFIDYVPMFLELSSNSEFKKIFSESLTNKNAQTAFLRSSIAHNIAIKNKNTSSFFLGRVILASYFCDFVNSDENGFHGSVNALMLEKIPNIPSDVILAIKHHHEYNDGTGPLKLKGPNIHPIAKFIRLADELILFGGLSSLEFNEKLETLKGKIDLPLLRSLKK